MRRRGREGHEGAVLLAGTLDAQIPPDALLDVVLIPRQIARRSLLGVSVEIPPEEAAELTAHLSRHNAILFGKIHSHPHEAYHSHTDDSNMLMQFDGALSVVVPDFCRAPLSGLLRCSAYRYTRVGWQWMELARSDMSQLIKIVDHKNVTVIDRNND